MLRIEVAESALQREVMHRLYTLYLHDLSEFTDHFRLNAEARWTPYYLDDWETRATCRSLLFRNGTGVPVGFAMVAHKPFPFMSTWADMRMAEFFVVRPARRTGVGREAARQILAGERGVWEVNEAPRNAAAITFWRGVIGEITGGDYQELDEPHQLTQRFAVR